MVDTGKLMKVITTINHYSDLEGEYNVFQESLNTDTELEWTTDIVKKFLNNDERELRFAFQLGVILIMMSSSFQGFSTSQGELIV